MDEPTGLLSAAQRGALVDVINLLKNGEDVNKIDKKGNTALHWALYFNEVKIVEILLQQPNILINSKSERGHTPLHLGSVNNSFEAVKVLIENSKGEIDLNSQNVWKETPLHLASSAGRGKIIDLLCKNGADPRLKDSWGRTPIRVAYENGEIETENALLNFCSKEEVEEAKKQAQEVHTNIFSGRPGESEERERRSKVAYLMEAFEKEVIGEDKINKIKERIASGESIIKINHIFDVGGKVVENSTPIMTQETHHRVSLAQKFEYGISPSDLNELNKFLQDPQIDNDGKDMYGWNAFQKALFFQQLEYVGVLLDHLQPATLNELDPESGQTVIETILTWITLESHDKLSKKALIEGKINIPEHIEELLKKICTSGKIQLEKKNSKGVSPIETAKQLTEQGRLVGSSIVLALLES